jgi:AcrR family transcriptional regulator
MPRPRSDIAPRLVSAATERFLREGVDGASLRAIARDAGTNIGMLYYYFPTKDDLFLAVVEDVYAGLLADLVQALHPDLPVEDRLRGLYRRFAAIGEHEFDVLRIVIREALVSSQRLARVVERFSRGHVPLVLQTVRDGVAGGTLDPALPFPSLVLCIAALAGLPQLVHRVLQHEAPALAPLLPAPDDLADIAFRVLFHGVRPPDGPS